MSNTSAHNIIFGHLECLDDCKYGSLHTSPIDCSRELGKFFIRSYFSSSIYKAITDKSSSYSYV